LFCYHNHTLFHSTWFLTNSFDSALSRIERKVVQLQFYVCNNCTRFICVNPNSTSRFQEHWAYIVKVYCVYSRNIRDTYYNVLCIYYSRSYARIYLVRNIYWQYSVVYLHDVINILSIYTVYIRTIYVTWRARAYTLLG